MSKKGRAGSSWLIDHWSLINTLPPTPYAIKPPPAKIRGLSLWFLFLGRGARLGDTKHICTFSWASLMIADRFYLENCAFTYRGQHLQFAYGPCLLQADLRHEAY